MKLRNFFELLGFKRKTKHFGYTIEECEIAPGTTVNYAKWQHKRSKHAAPISSEFVEAYRKILNEGDFCIDIGAHMGDSTLPMAIAVGKKGCTLALEPNPYVYHVLEKNARANKHLTNIVTIMAGVAPKSGFIQFEYSDPGYCNGGRHEGISSFTHAHAYKLEAFCLNLENELKSDFSEWLPKLKFVKVDTEGFDLYVLRSLESTLKKNMPIIKAEVFKSTSSSYREELLSFCEQLGYIVYKTVNEPLDAGEQLTKKNVGKPGEHYDILCVPNSSPVMPD